MAAQLDGDYGSSGRLVTAENGNSQGSANQNVTFGQGNIYSQSTWGNNTTQPSIAITRDGTFPSGLSVNNSPYIFTIREKGRFVLTEIGGTGRVLYSDYCIFKTKHTLEVSSIGGFNVVKFGCPALNVILSSFGVEL